MSVLVSSGSYPFAPDEQVFSNLAPFDLVIGAYSSAIFSSNEQNVLKFDEMKLCTFCLAVVQSVLFL